MGIIFLIMFMVSFPVLADRVLIRNSDGVPIEYQSGDGPLGTLTNNHPEYQPGEVTEKYITMEDYKVLHQEKITTPAIVQKELEQTEIRERLKAKFGFTDADLDDLNNIK